MEKYYSFAGVNIAVRIPEEIIYTDDKLLGAFYKNSVAEPHVFTFETVEKLPAPKGECVAVQPGFLVYKDGMTNTRYLGTVKKSWESAYACAAHCGKEHKIQILSSIVADKIFVKTVLNCLETEHLVTECGGFVFHCSYINIGGKAVLFTAPSGVGKSTQAELWRKLRGAEIVNGDRAVVRCDDRGIYACGIPFAGSSEYCINKELPLAAIVYLEQAPQTTIRRASGYEAFSKIWEGCSINTWETADVAAVSGSVENVAANVPVFHLACTADETAVRELESVLKG